jgi:hypothetical protein
MKTVTINRAPVLTLWAAGELDLSLIRKLARKA